MVADGLLYRLYKFDISLISVIPESSDTRSYDLLQITNCY